VSFKDNYDDIDWSYARKAARKRKAEKRREVFHIIRDIQPFKSPLGHGVIDGRKELREHLARNDCRIVEPGEYKPTYVNPKYQKYNGDR
jgi:hypothetical protein